MKGYLKILALLLLTTSFITASPITTADSIPPCSVSGSANWATLTKSGNINIQSTFNNNCSVEVNASGYNVTLSSSSINVNGTLYIIGDNVNLHGSINAHRIIVQSNCFNVYSNAYINIAGSQSGYDYAEFVSQNPNCTSYFNGTLNVSTNSSPLTYGNSGFAVMFSSQGSISLNGGSVYTFPATTGFSHANMLVKASNATVSNFNFSLTSGDNGGLLFISNTPVILTQTTIPSIALFVPCVYDVDNPLAGTCSPLFLYGNINSAGGAVLENGSIELKNIVDSRDNPVVSWPLGLQIFYYNTIFNGVLNLEVFVPVVDYSRNLYYLDMVISSSPQFSCLYPNVCEEFLLPVLNQ